jgi:hypothetical protein
VCSALWLGALLLLMLLLMLLLLMPHGIRCQQSSQGMRTHGRPR